jgi:hypothetical protein
MDFQVVIRHFQSEIASMWGIGCVFGKFLGKTRGIKSFREISGVYFLFFSCQIKILQDSWIKAFTFVQDSRKVKLEIENFFKMV